MRRIDRDTFAASMRPPQRRGGNRVNVTVGGFGTVSFNEAPPKAGGKSPIQASAMARKIPLQ